MKNIAVIGLGKVGSLVGTLLHDIFTVTGVDVKAPAEPVPFEVVHGNVSDAAFMSRKYNFKFANLKTNSFRAIPCCRQAIARAC